MLTSLSSIMGDKSIYHIIKFNDGTLSYGTFFVVNINEFGFVKADIIFPEELDVINVLPMVQRVHYHEIDISESANTEITGKVRIKVIFSEHTKQIILEADDQCWYKGVNNGYLDNSYFQGTLELLLFMQTLPKLHNGERSKAIYPSFYKAQYCYLNHIRKHRYSSSSKFEDEKENFEKWESVEYRKKSEVYFHLLHNSHPKRYEGKRETFKKWAEETETFYQERLQRKK